MGFAKSADQVLGLIKNQKTLKDVFKDIQNNTEIVLSENAPEPGNRPIPSGNRSPFMFVGQNPSHVGSTDGRFEEGQVQKFFEDKKLGKWIDKIAEYLGLQRSDLYVTNALKYPTENNDEPWFKDGKVHLKHFFFDEVYLVKPEIIFVMGDWTRRLFEKVFHLELPKEKLIKATLPITIDGKDVEYETYLYNIYHPAYIARNNDFSLYQKQLDQVCDLVKELTIDWKFVHLHVHNSLSLKDGVGVPETRVQWAVENGKPAVATTNHGTIGDWLNIYNGCKANGIKPVLGCEFYFNREAEKLRQAVAGDSPEDVKTRKITRKRYQSHFTAFAKNLTGYYNMIKIHNDAWVNGFYMFPYTHPEVIKNHSEGIICFSGCSGSEQNRILSQKFFLQSEERKEQIERLLNDKFKSMRGLIRTGNEEKYSSDEVLDDFDWEYYVKHKGEKVNEEAYKEYAREKILASDQELINSADQRARQVIDWWHGVFGDDYYIEIMVIEYEVQRLVNQELIKIAREKNLPIVLTNDSHYLMKADAQVQQLQMLNDQDKTFEDLKNDEEGKIWTIKSDDLYYKSVEELKESWEKFHKSDVFTEDVFWEGIQNAIAVVDKVENFTIDKSNKLPQLSDDPVKALAKKVHEGLKNRGLDKSKPHLERTKFEFEIIVKKGFADYFLILLDIIQWTKDNFGRFSVGAGRGSAAGSLVNYLLDITDVDPLKHDLMFERFLDIARADAVDIDTDFEPRIRDNVIDYMVQRFGSEYVSAIGTYGITRTKVAIQDVARVFGIPPAETFALTKNHLKDADDDAPLEQLEEEVPELKKYLDKWEAQGYKLRYFINGVRNAHRQISQHAAGVLVSSDKLMDSVALVQARKRIVTAWQEGSDYHELSDLGYYKYDILGLNNLQVVNDTHALVRDRRGVEIDWDNVDLDEKFVYQNVVKNHDHYGVFQYESPLARRLMRDILPDNFEELSAVSSLLRPGPLRMGMHTEFADRKHGNKVEGKDYEIPECIRDILGYTFGIIVYQEQFMQIANKIGGLSRAETNAFRKALVKYGKSAEQEAKRYAQVQSYHDKFVATASKPEFLGDKLKAEELWQLIASFAAYGFNKSHSISYTYTSFREYYLKAYYDPEFNVSLLNNTDKGKESRGESVIAQYITEMIKKGYAITPPDINRSEYKFTLGNDDPDCHEIVWGLGWVKNLSDGAIQKIVEEREQNGVFSSVEDLYTRVGKKLLNKRAIEALVWSGALDIFGDREEVHAEIYEELRKDKNYTAPKMNEKKIIEKEIEFCSISLTEIKTFARMKKDIEDTIGYELEPLFEADETGDHVCLGKVENIESRKTKTKKDYVRISLRDQSKVLKAVYVWPWKCRNAFGLKNGQMIIAQISNDGNFKNLTGYYDIEGDV